MSLFLPTVAVSSVTDITIDLLRSLKTDVIFLDVDNTLACHGSQEPFKGALEWTQKVRAEGIDIIIISNNFKSRVAPFAEKFNLPYVYSAQKPLPLGMHWAKKKLGKTPQHPLVVGDQIFTDIWGANMARMKSILLEPVVHEESLSFRFRRWLERSMRRKIAQRKGEDHYVR